MAGSLLGRYTARMNRSLCRWIVGCVLWLLPLQVGFAAMSSTNYQVPWDAWGAGGAELGSSASYRIDDTLGGTAVGTSTGAAYLTRAGYRLGDAQALSFSVLMAPVGGTSVSYGGLNASTRLVTLSGSNPFSVGQSVAIVESPGLSQKTAVGRVAAVAGSTITLDRLDGQPSTMDAAPASGRVLLLSGGDIAFGEVAVSTGAVATGVALVQALTPSGYTLYMQAAAALASDAHAFSPVADGAVTAGTEEYGMRTYGTTSQVTVDTAVSTTAVSVQGSSTISATGGDRTALLYKLAISTATPAGAYSQSVFFTLTPNY